MLIFSQKKRKACQAWYILFHNRSIDCIVPEPTMKSANIKRFDTFNSVKCRIRSKHNHQVDRFHSLISNYWHTSKKGLLLLIGSVREILQSGLTSRILHLGSRASIDNLKACTKGVIGSFVLSSLLIIFCKRSRNGRGRLFRVSRRKRRREGGREKEKTTHRLRNECNKNKFRV